MGNVEKGSDTNRLSVKCIMFLLGTTVLVHGDAGTDATLQVTSLVQVLLDPLCRTTKG